MKKKLVSMIFFLLFMNLHSIELIPEKSEIIPNLQRPRYMYIDNERIYIVENRVKIKGYSIKTFKKCFTIKIRKGQGPGEYPWAPMIISDNKHIYIKTTTKIAQYTKDGKYLNEHKLRGRGIIFPFGKNYVFWYFHYEKKTKTTFLIVDLINAKNRRIKRVFTFEHKKAFTPSMITRSSGKGQIYLLGKERLSIAVSEHKIFILIPNKDIELKIFNLKGNLIKTVKNIKIPKVKIKPEDKLNLMNNFKYVNGFSNSKWKIFKKRYNFYHPDFFPRFDKIKVDADTIYIKTYKGIKNKKEFLIYDIKGNLKRNFFLPESKIWKIKNGKYYYLIFSEDEEEWRLNRISI